MSDASTAFQISVRELVEFVYRSGSLDLRFQGKSKLQDGIKLHQKIQKSQGIAYRSEVTLSRQIEVFDEVSKAVLLVSGRADGIIDIDGETTIDEIKGTSIFLESIEIDTFPVHWAQAKIYGAIYGRDNNLNHITIQLTYANFESNEVKRLRKIYSIEELEAFFIATVELYKKWLFLKNQWRYERNNSLEGIAFPFERYRPGQRKLAVSIYNKIKTGGILYAEAPTGIGKTMSTLFPSLKAMSQGLVDRIFYLSAKTITKVVAEEAVTRLYEESDQTLKLKSLTLTAKDKICLNEEVTCYPEKCPYADGYFDRSLDALWDIVSNERSFDKDTVVRYAQKHKVCPYEFSLDVALFSDLIICDYNYAFDPRVYLRRFFEFPTEKYVFLVDEAHNLVDRARTMYSAELQKDKFLSVKKQLGQVDKSLSKAIDGINKALLEVRKACDDRGLYISADEKQDIYEQLKRRSGTIEKWLSENHLAPFYQEVLDLYFDIIGYMRISELYDSGYLFYITEGDKNTTKYKLFNINPASQLKRFIDNSVATIFFSATLTPLAYYSTLLTGDVEPEALSLPSPFDTANRKLVYATDVSVKYKDRETSVRGLCQYIDTMAAAKKGNYLVFFPSYAYLKQVADLFETLYIDKYDIIKQSRDLSEADKEDFLQTFDADAIMLRDKSLIGFAVLGGHFAEGIDLKGERLIGVIVVGVGLPMISFENDLIKNFFDYEMDAGYEFAYQFPGIGKVMQSAGRVIRGETDTGVIILIDQRFQSLTYQRILPPRWGKETTNLDTLKRQLDDFWEEHR
ncbi:MAG: hypothetical protein BGO41_05785 [Clostridiales bacterium 38-18]|nr:MAG: hypothetical protein BGO41_05785 [Clostridiales bacterium 38-18]